MSERHPAFDVRLLGGEAAIGLAGQIWPCYRDVFADFADMQTWRDSMYDRHAARDGYRLAVAVAGSAVAGSAVAGSAVAGSAVAGSVVAGSVVAGFSWGYVGQRGQYWTDLVWEALPADVTGEWVGGHFEFVELAVLPRYRRLGVGRRLHDTLLAGISRRCLLSTSDDPDDPAAQLYSSCGWRKLGALRPGVQVMGLMPPSPGDPAHV
jgi:ribosomal protein S18 acetylase RimI-like enzyme